MTKTRAPVSVCLALLLLTGGAACTTLKRLDYEGWVRG